MPSKNYLDTTIQDFSGGLSVVDNELNLDPKYAVVLENIGRASDGSMQPRYGTRLIYDGKDGDEIPLTGATLTLTVTSGSTFVKGQLNATGKATNGGHITFGASPTTFGNLNNIIRGLTYGIRVPADGSSGSMSFSFHLRNVASFSGTYSVFSATFDNHTLAGEIVNAWYFQNYMILADDVGEIIAVDQEAVATELWKFSKFIQQSGADPHTNSGWRRTSYANADVNKSTMIIGNGADFPVIVDMNATVQCQYLVDPATGSNAGIPKAALLKTNSTFLTAVAPDKAATVRISAKNTNSVFTGNVDPDDAIDVDATQITTAVNPELRALNTIRDRLFVAFEDGSMLAQLGIYNSSGGHTPNFTDIIAQVGCISQRTCVSLGNDIFMLDYTGVPSLTVSLNSGAFVPSRISDLIEPLLQKNIARLSERTLVRKAFAVWATRARQYMLFLPKYDPETLYSLPANPILILNDNVGKAEATIYFPSHGFEVGDQVLIADLFVSVGNLTYDQIAGTRKILRIINENYFVIETAAVTTVTADYTGGDRVTVRPIADETIGYIYHFNSGLRIKAWSIYRGLNFSAGFRSLLGEAYFCKGAKVYKFGSSADPIYTDQQGDYDYRHWSSGKSYVVGDRVLDEDTNTVYQCAVAHTASGSSFSVYRDAHPVDWILDTGKAINWVWELPWADFAKRWSVKTLRYFMPNATGSGKMKVDMFVDQIYRNPKTRELAPARSMSFVAADAGGFGNGNQSFGGGRRVREELLWHVPLKAKLLKLRLTGAASEPLRIVGLSFIYQIGSYRR